MWLSFIEVFERWFRRDPVDPRWAKFRGLLTIYPSFSEGTLDLSELVERQATYSRTLRVYELRSKAKPVSVIS
jgi:hypothetical protein